MLSELTFVFSSSASARRLEREEESVLFCSVRSFMRLLDISRLEEEVERSLERDVEVALRELSSEIRFAFVTLSEDISVDKTRK